MTQSKTPSFEEAFARLETILDAMNSGKTSLEESLQLYEEADKLIAFCNKALSNAEQKIEMLVKNREGELILSGEGKPTSNDFSLNSTQKFSV